MDRDMSHLGTCGKCHFFLQKGKVQAGRLAGQSYGECRKNPPSGVGVRPVPNKDLVKPGEQTYSVEPIFAYPNVIANDTGCGEFKEYRDPNSVDLTKLKSD